MRRPPSIRWGSDWRIGHLSEGARKQRGTLWLVAAVLLGGWLTAGCLPPPSAGPATASGPATARDMAVPATIGDWAVLTEERRLTPRRFFDESAAAAAPYLLFPVQGVTVYAYADPATGKPAFEARVISLTSPLEAWGLCNLLRRAAGGAPAVATPRGFRREGEVTFFQDRLAVSLTARAEGLPASRLEQAAAAFEALLPGKGEVPREVKALAAAGADPAALVYEPTAILGKRTLAPGLTGPVVLSSGDRSTLFVSVQAGTDEAAGAFQDIIIAASSGSKGVGFTLGVGEAAATIWDQEMGWMDLARKDNYLVGIVGMKDPSVGWERITAMVTSLGG